MPDEGKKILVVAEKPSVARDIARVLGCREKGEGFIAGERYIISWALGHLVSLCEPDELNPAYKKWRAEDLPILPPAMKRKVLPKTRSQFLVLKKLMNDPLVVSLVCATDAGREGELIFRYIYLEAGCKKPVERLWISSMTDQAIREGFSRLRADAEYDALYESARCRGEADWLVGMNASRAFTLRYGALLSLGRVQTPTLRLIVERDREIRAFVPEDYWEARADFGDYEGLWQNPERQDSHIPSEKAAREIREQTLGKTGVVTESRREKKSLPPPQLFDLTSLQREMNRLRGLSAAKTLEIAQALYERHKLITYPRSDCRYLPTDMIPSMAKTFSQMPAPWAEFARKLLPKQPVSRRVYDDQKLSDHHAIVPTGQFSALSRLTESEAAVFDAIARRSVAAHYPPYEYESALIGTVVAGHLFKTSGQTPLSPGWKALYPPAEKETAEAERPVPQLAVGAERVVKKLSVKKLKTKPPAPHTDASILYLMETAGKTLSDEALRDTMKDSGLGTPATRAQILERLCQVGYAKRQGKALRATEKGEKLISVAPAEITTPEMTGKWERALSKIAREGDARALTERSGRFMDSIRRYSAFLVESAGKADAGVVFEREPYKPKRRAAPRSAGGAASKKSAAVRKKK